MKLQIELDQTKAKHLLKAVFMYNWVMNATKLEDEVDQEVEEFEQFILGQIHNSGLPDHVEYSSEDSTYSLNSELEEEFYEDIQAYGSDAFWEDLSDRLAERDLGEMDNQPDTQEEFFDLHSQIEEEYNQEFETMGLKRLRVTK